MSDPQTTAIIVTVTVALARSIEWLAKALLAKGARNGNGNHVKGVQSGQLTPEDWEGRMTKLHNESEERIMADIRMLFTSRTDQLRTVIREELNNFKLRR